MHGATSLHLARVVEGTVSIATGIPGLMASPVPRDRELCFGLQALDTPGIIALLERLSFHRLDGLAHRAVGRLPQEAIDPWLRSALKRRARRLAAATLSQALALAEVLEALERSRIPVVVMRGLRSVESIYGDPSLRPFEDHDLLVLPADRVAAGSALKRLGFEEAAGCLYRRGGVLVDLHTDPLGARRRPSRDLLFPVPVRDLFERGAPGLVAGAPALLLEPEDELLLLAIHLVKHSFDRLVRTADLAHYLFVNRGVLDWTLLARRADSWGSSRVLGWALQAAATLGVSLRSFDLPPARDTSALERYLMGRVLALRPLPGTGEFLMALAAPTLRARLLFLLGALWPESERPHGVLGRTSALPRRVFHLAGGGMRQAAERRRLR
ncbi:MAG: hypothetical protein AUI47_03175 [Acidobacteria bacterium 13_1_40CM_2_68_5]|nr:MAG: hypothetical protein AUI47_03175 [Acidobacteria bacterium 13_1_40CM_2_68_5]